MMLADKVPKGIVGKIEFSFIPSPQRHKAPQAAPILIDKMANIFMTFLPRCKTDHNSYLNIGQYATSDLIRSSNQSYLVKNELT